MFESELEIPARRASTARPRHAAGRADGPSRPHTLLPAVLGDIDGRAIIDGLEAELGRARVPSRGRGRTSALGLGARDAAADGQLGYVLVVKDDSP